MAAKNGGGRNSKLTPEVHEAIITALASGATIVSVCAFVGITDRSYHSWMERGSKEVARRLNNGIKTSGKKWDEEEPFLQFFQSATRAKSTGLVNAAGAFRAGMNPSRSVTDTTTTKSETRLRTIKHDDGTREEVPYTHSVTETRQAVTNSPGDWRAAMEYLGRRDPDNWARQRLELTGKDGGPIKTQTKVIVEFVKGNPKLAKRDNDSTDGTA